MPTTRRKLPRLFKTFGLALYFAACNSVPPTDPTTAPLSGSGTLSGEVSWSVDGGPVSGAHVDLEGVVGRTDSQGTVVLSGVYTDGPGRITITGNGILSRETRVQASPARSAVRLDVIPAGFATFYRYIARDNRDLPLVLKPTARWTTNPSFYIKTTLEDVTDDVPPEIISDVVRVLTNSVPELTAGEYVALTVQTGRETRPSTDGWINLTFRRTVPGGILGQTFAGANPGRMEVIYRSCGRPIRFRQS